MQSATNILGKLGNLGTTPQHKGGASGSGGIKKAISTTAPESSSNQGGPVDENGNPIEESKDLTVAEADKQQLATSYKSYSNDKKAATRAVTEGKNPAEILKEINGNQASNPEKTWSAETSATSPEGLSRDLTTIGGLPEVPGSTRPDLARQGVNPESLAYDNNSINQRFGYADASDLAQNSGLNSFGPGRGLAGLGLQGQGGGNVNIAVAQAGGGVVNTLENITPITTQQPVIENTSISKGPNESTETRYEKVEKRYEETL